MVSGSYGKPRSRISDLRLLPGAEVFRRDFQRLIGVKRFTRVQNNLSRPSSWLHREFLILIQ